MLPEVFGVNGWVRSVAAHGAKAPGLDLSYSDQASRAQRSRPGFISEERSSLNPEASSQGWQLLLEG